MLEASGFDFRNRYPQKLLLKLARHYSVDQVTVGKTAYNMSLDLYRTLAPLKQTAATMAVSCIELAGRVWDQNLRQLEAQTGYKEFHITRAEVMGESARREPLSLSTSNSGSRNNTGPARLIHPSPNIDNRRARLSTRKIYQHPNCTEPGSFSRRNPSSHSNQEESSCR